jgi:alkylhydroperoxidase family enzyme
MSERVAQLDVAESRRRAEAVGIPKRMAELSVFRILLHHPPVAKAIYGMLAALLFGDNKLDPRLRELVIMRIGWATGSNYEWTQHWRVAKDLGLSEELILSVRDWRDAHDLTEADRAVLQATDDTLSTGSIGERTWETICEVLATEEERIELVAAIGNWGLFSRLLRSLDVPLEENLESWPPDGKVPAVDA